MTNDHPLERLREALVVYDARSKSYYDTAPALAEAAHALVAECDRALEDGDWA